MNLELLRFTPNTDGTIHGCLLIINNNNIQDCFTTVENEKYKIPIGGYKIHVSHSPKFNSDLPYIIVPKRKGIRIHYGSNKSHTRGCILVQRSRIAIPKINYYISKGFKTINIFNL